MTSSFAKLVDHRSVLLRDAREQSCDLCGRFSRLHFGTRELGLRALQALGDGRGGTEYPRCDSVRQVRDFGRSVSILESSALGVCVASASRFG